jgi:Tfp pilus assembly protein PilO
MSLSDRDRKILFAIVPLLVALAYWFLLFSPKREEAATAATELAEQQERRDAAKQLVDQANAAQTDFAADYGEIVRLGKAIPSRVDMPSLLVQLDRAADGTDIEFTRISAGERTSLTAAAPASGSSSSSTPPVAAGGAPAQSAPGTATESANTAADTSEQRSSAAESSGVNAADTQTSTSSGGGLPVGGGTATAGGSAQAPAAPTLETVPLDLEFQGNFFRLADFFHDIKRFVHVVNENVVVNGRLVTIEGVTFASDPQIFPRIKAELTATVYLSPLAQGAAAGATPQGPAATTPASTTPAPSEGSTPAPTPAPTAAATP